MRYSFSALALAVLHHVIAFAQDCPTGYNRTIEWHECPTEEAPELQCAILTVPLDYLDKTSTASIAVPVVRVAATSPNPNGDQSIIYNPGGEYFHAGAGTVRPNIHHIELQSYLDSLTDT